MNTLEKITLALACISMVACSSSNNNNTTKDTGGTLKPEVEIIGPFNTGTSSEPASFYFDLDTGTQVMLTSEEAANNSVWDLHFRRTDILLNAKASTPVSAYFTGNNADYYDAEGEPVNALFIAASADDEQADFTAVDAADLPANEMFTTDVDTLAIGGKFYNYDPLTHQVSAADDKYFIVQSDGNFSRVRAKSLVASGRVMASMTLGISVQNAVSGDTQFTSEVDVVLDTVACSDDIYVDLDTYSVVPSDGDWDITLPCMTVAPDTGAGFEINLAEDASAIDDSADGYDGISIEALSHYKFQDNQTQVKFFKTYPWYEYALNGGHGIWSQFGVYLIKTESATYKFQITSYYDEAGVSGQFNFRFEAL